MGFIDAMKYPLFARFKCPASSVGRWEIKEGQAPIKIANAVICPGDFIFGNVDGLVVVPKDPTPDVLIAAEDVCERETGMRREPRSGVSIQDACAKYGPL